ncbi:MAG: DUF4160 domain-containing protein [Acidobacteriota bacterium]
MPTILRLGPYRIFYFDHEPSGPPNVHVDRDHSSAKFWLRPVSLARNLGFTPSELRKIEKIVLENQQQLLEARYGRFRR